MYFRKKMTIALCSLILSISLGGLQPLKGRSSSDEIIRVAEDLWFVDVLLHTFFGIGYLIADGGEGTLDYLKTREEGDPLLPIFRFETSYQQLSSSRYAADLQAEAGYGLFSVSFRQTQYHGTTQTTRQHNIHDVYQYFGHYRMMAMKKMQIDIAVGSITLDGTENHSGTALSLPLHFFPSKNIGLHFRPAWATITSNKVRDYDLAASYHHKNLLVKLGYRWFRHHTQVQKGPTLGLQYNF